MLSTAITFFRNFHVPVLVFIGCLWVYFFVSNFPNAPQNVNKYLETKTRSINDTQEAQNKAIDSVPQQIIKDPADIINANGG